MLSQAAGEGGSWPLREAAEVLSLAYPPSQHCLGRFPALPMRGAPSGCLSQPAGMPVNDPITVYIVGAGSNSHPVEVLQLSTFSTNGGRWKEVS